MVRLPGLMAMGSFLAVTSNGLADVINVPGDYPTIQIAIANASNGDEIVVGPGTYYGPVTMSGTFITLRSSAGPAATTIDATGFNDIAVKCWPGCGTWVIDGFTITGGHAPFGGGIRAQPSPPNKVLVNNCIVIGNTAENQGGGIYGQGDLTVSNSTIVGNSAPGAGSGAYLTDARLNNCQFSQNFPSDSAADGGGLVALNVVATNCIIRNNTAGEGQGGGIHVFAASSFVNCLIEGNVANVGGGISGTQGTFVNCTVVSNIANNPSVGGGAHVTTSSFTNVILWGNSPQELNESAGVVRFSNVLGGWSGAGEGNIAVNPLFIDAANMDYRLSAASPCIDACDSNAYLGPFVDLDGVARGLDDPSVANSGIPAAGTGLVIDMGAYEFKRPACAGDVSGDAVVNPKDLALLLGSWGPCP